MTRRMGRGMAALAGVLAMGGCALFQPQMRSTQTEMAEPFVLGGGGPSLALVEPQVSVVSAPQVGSFAGGRTFAHWCADCHGARGQGDGPLATQTDERPSDLTALARGNGGSFPARHVGNRLTMAPGPYHRGIAPALAQDLSGPLVEWEGGYLTTDGMAELLGYLAGLQG